MAFHVNQRLSYSGELCTVRYVGSVPNWPGCTAVGVEWDSRDGKNSGKLDGVRYFDGE